MPKIRKKKTAQKGPKDMPQGNRLSRDDQGPATGPTQRKKIKEKGNDFNLELTGPLEGGGEEKNKTPPLRLKGRAPGAQPFVRLGAQCFIAVQKQGKGETPEPAREQREEKVRRPIKRTKGQEKRKNCRRLKEWGKIFLSIPERTE